MGAEDRDTRAQWHSAEAEDLAERARQRARSALERATRARERGKQVSRRLEELSAEMPAPVRRFSAQVLAAEEAVHHSAREVDRGRGLALIAFERAARGRERAARNHDKIADVLERHAGDGPPGERDELVRLAQDHRVKASHNRHEAAVDWEAAENLRRDTRGPGGNREPVPD